MDSKLASYTNISANNSGKRTHAIDTITIHCMAGQATGRNCANYLSSANVGASANYCVGYDGDIAVSVPEDMRSWASSDRENDQRAVTIEVASDSFAPYAVKPKAYEALIQLCADVCRRNGIKKLVWSNIKADRINHRNGCNMTVHMDYANKACPGLWLYSRMGEIADKVNSILEENDMTRYNSTAEMPNAYAKVIQPLVDGGIIAGRSGGGLDLSEDMVRCIVYLDRILKKSAPTVDVDAIADAVADKLADKIVKAFGEGK